MYLRFWESVSGESCPLFLCLPAVGGEEDSSPAVQLTGHAGRRQQAASSGHAPTLIIDNHRFFFQSRRYNRKHKMSHGSVSWAESGPIKDVMRRGIIL
jgi:hypothetical protein